MPHFWMDSGCTASGIGPFLRHFHTSARKNDLFLVITLSEPAALTQLAVFLLLNLIIAEQGKE